MATAEPAAIALEDATVAFRLADSRVYTAVEKAKLFSILNYSGLPISAQPIVDEIRAKLAEAPRLSAVPR